jgi:putative DNA primase/helicase
MALVANITGPDDRESIKAVVKRLSTESLDSTDEFQVLTAIKKVTKLPLPELRKQVAEFRREVRNAKMKPTHAGYAGRLLEILEEESGVDPVSCGGSLYIYSEKKGIYEQQTQESIRSLVVDHFDDSELCIRGSDYSAIANLTIGGNDKPTFFDEAPIGLACKGRFYFINKDGAIEKEKLNSDHRQRFLTTVVPVAGETPMFDQFLQETFENNDAVNQIALLQEVFGAILIGYMPKLEKALFLKGPGRSGKSTILKIIRAMFSPDVQCASSPFDWDHEYSRASLLGKRLNIVGELPLDKPIPSHDFKTITGRDPINARLPYGAPFTFSPTAAHVFSSNHYIYTADHSDAFFARFVVIECANSRAFNDSAIITDLADQIIENELSSIMAWGLQGAKRLLENKGVLTATKTSARMFAEWMKSSSSVMEFMTDEDVVEYGQHKTHAVNRGDFYSAYTEWCKESGRRPMSKRRVYDELVTRPFARFMLKMVDNGDGKRLIRGVKLKRDNWVVPMEDDDEL